MGAKALAQFDPQILDNDNFCGTGFSVHPMAAMLPLIEGEELDQLVASIENGGLLHPITLHGNVILDGRNRLRACLLADYKPKYAKYEGDENEIFYFILRQNIRRRMLTPDQRVAIVAEMQAMHYAEEAKRAMSAGQKTGGQSGGRGRQNSSALISTQSYRAPETSKRLAKLADVGDYKARQAIKLTKSPKLLMEVAQGKTKLKDAANAIKSKPAQSKPREAKAWDFDTEVKKASRSIRKRAESADDYAAFINAVIVLLRKSTRENS